MAAETLTGGLAPHPGARLVRLGDSVAARNGDQVTVARDPATHALLEALFAASESGEPLALDGIPDDAREAVLALYERLRDGLAVAPRDEAAELTDATPVVRGLWARGGESVDVGTVARRLAERTIALHGDGPLAERVAAELSAAGARVRRAPSDAAPDADAGVTVFVAQGDDDPLLQAFNRAAHEAGRPWLLVTPFDGVRATVGPLVLPGATACAECLRLRRASTFPARELVAELSGPVATAHPGLPAAQPGLELAVVGAVVDVALARVALDEHAPSGRPGALTTWTAGPRGPEAEEHRILRVPRCGVCSVADGTARPQVWAHPDPPAGEVPSC